MISLLRVGLMFSCMLVFSVLPAAAEDFSSILATAQGDHVWVVSPKPQDSTESKDSTTVCHVLHYSVAEGPSEARAVVRLPRWPEAIVSSGAQLWMVFAPRDAEMSSRDVVSLRVERNSATGLYYAVPHNHLEVHPSLPRTSRIVGIATTQDQIFALELPGLRVARGISRDLPTKEDEPTDSSEKEVAQETGLLQLDALKWVRIPGPPGLAQANTGLLGNTSVDDERQLAVAWPVEEKQRTKISIFSTDDSQSEHSEWRTETIDVPFAQVRALLSVEGGLLLAHGEETIEFSYLRAKGRLAKLASVDLDKVPWTVAALPDGLRIFERRGDLFSVRTVGLIEGGVGEPTDITENSDAVDWLQLPLAGMVIIAILVGVLILRPFIESATSDPAPGLQPMPLGRRMAALVIDLIPGAIIVMVVFKLSAAEFAESFISIQAETTLPAFILVLITGLHSGITEIIFGASLGKAILGGKVVALDNANASKLQRGLRGAGKIVILILPLLSLLVILDPLSRGLPELITRTIVVNRGQRGPASGDQEAPEEQDDEPEKTPG